MPDSQTVCRVTINCYRKGVHGLWFIHCHGCGHLQTGIVTYDSAFRIATEHREGRHG